MSAEIHVLRPSFASAPQAQPEWLSIVQRKAESLAYGVVQIVVHDHRVTQIEVTEKTRLEGQPTLRN
jgi:hypothetical protein